MGDLCGSTRPDTGLAGLVDDVTGGSAMVVGSAGLGRGVSFGVVSEVGIIIAFGVNAVGGSKITKVLLFA